MRFRGMLAALAAMFGAAHGSAQRSPSVSPLSPLSPSGHGTGKHRGGRNGRRQRVARPGSRLSFRPLGAPLSIEVRKGLTWGHVHVYRSTKSTPAAKAA